LLDFTIHYRWNEIQSLKSTCVKTMCVHSAVSRGRLTAIGLRKCGLGLPSRLLSLRQLQQ
jgi:hypothetical protein